MLSQERPPAPPKRPVWHTNDSLKLARRSAYLSLFLSGALLATAGFNLAAGDTSIFTFLILFLAFYFTDDAVGRLLSLSRAPREIGIAEDGVTFRNARGEETIRWAEVRGVHASTVGRRLPVARFTLLDGRSRSVAGVPPGLSQEIELAWLEATARDPELRRRVGAPATPAQAPAPVTPALIRLSPSPSPQYWVPSARIDPARPVWSYTRVKEDQPIPDPAYAGRLGAPREFVWHFVPARRSHAGGALLLLGLFFVGIALAAIAANVLLLFGKDSDPWSIMGIGAALGLALALVGWRRAREEIAGEIAGSILFLSSLDRTMGDLVATLRAAAGDLGAGEARERRGRRRLVLDWPSAHTRATVVQGPHDTRAIVLKTVGNSRYEMHARLKGAILERLGVDPRRR